MAVRAAFPGRYTFQHTLFYWHRYFRFFPKLFLYHFCPFFLWDLGHAKDWIVLGCVPRLFRTCIVEPGPSPSLAWAFGPQRINGPGPRIIGPHKTHSAKLRIQLKSNWIFSKFGLLILWGPIIRGPGPFIRWGPKAQAEEGYGPGSAIQVRNSLGIQPRTACPRSHRKEGQKRYRTNLEENLKYLGQ